MPRRPRNVRQGTHPERAEASERSQAEDRWLDLIAEIIAEELLNEASKNAHALRRVREVQ